MFAPRVDVSISTEGEQRLARFVHLLHNGYKYKLSDFQREFASQCTQALAPIIVGKDWASVGERIMRAHGWTDKRSMMAACTPRRFGKSYVICRVAATLAIVCMGIVQAVFSTGKRASVGDLRYLQQLICEAGMKHLIVKSNQENLWLQSDRDDDNTICQINCYPGSTTIGTAAHRLFVFGFFFRSLLGTFSLDFRDYFHVANVE